MQKPVTELLSYLYFPRAAVQCKEACDFKRRYAQSKILNETAGGEKFRGHTDEEDCDKVLFSRSWMLWKGRKVKDSYYLTEASSVEVCHDGLALLVPLWTQPTELKV